MPKRNWIGAWIWAFANGNTFLESRTVNHMLRIGGGDHIS